MWMHPRISENLWSPFCVKICWFVCQVFYFPQHQISMIFLFVIASFLINLAHCLVEMVLKLWDWQISLWLWPEWLITWSGHLLRVGSFSWLMEMGQAGGRRSWEGTRYWFEISFILYEIEIIVTNSSFSSSIYLQFYSRGKSSEWQINMI